MATLLESVMHYGGVTNWELLLGLHLLVNASGLPKLFLLVRGTTDEVLFKDCVLCSRGIALLVNLANSAVQLTFVTNFPTRKIESEPQINTSLPQRFQVHFC